MEWPPDPVESDSRVLRPVGEGIEFHGNTRDASVPPEICAP